jgi:hypothetical protein
MSVAPAGTTSVLVAVSGVLQDPSTYSVSGTTLTFSAAPPSGTANISARYLGIPASGVTTTAYRTITVFTATANQTTFTPPSYTAGFINVFRNGVLLTPTSDYTATNGTTVVLVSGATAGDTIQIESFYVSSILNAIPATTGSVANAYLGPISTLPVTGGYTATLPAATGTVMVSGNMPVFFVYNNAAQSFSNSTFTKLQLNTKVFDTASYFDATTNYRFTPQVAGYYQINGQSAFTGAASGYAQINIYKNGANYLNGSASPNNTQVGAQCSVSGLIYMNGSTDYIELWAWQASGGSLNTQANSQYNYLSGSLVRAA